MEYKIIRDKEDGDVIVVIHSDEEMNISKGFLLIGERGELPRLMVNIDKIFAIEKI